MTEFNSLQGEYLLNVDGKYYNTLDISGFSQMVNYPRPKGHGLVTAQSYERHTSPTFNPKRYCYLKWRYITSSLNIPALNFSVWFFHAAYFFL